MGLDEFRLMAFNNYLYPSKLLMEKIEKDIEDRIDERCLDIAQMIILKKKDTEEM